MIENKLLKCACTFLVSIALLVSFMPVMSFEAFAVTPFAWNITTNESWHYCKKDETSVILSVMDFIEADTSVYESDFNYEWSMHTGYDEEENEEIWELISGENSSTYTVAPCYGDYRCKITNADYADDYSYIFFKVREYSPQPVAASFKSNGSHDLLEYSMGWFRQDKIEDTEGNHVSDTDYYFFYDSNYESDDYDGEGYEGYLNFNIGDEITINFDDGTSKTYKYQTKTYTYVFDGDLEENIATAFFNGNEKLSIYARLAENQSFNNQLKLGSTFDAEILTYLYDINGDMVTVRVNNFGKIVKNTNAVYKNYMLFLRNSESNTAYIRGFYGINVSSVTIPESVTFADGKKFAINSIKAGLFNDPAIKSITVPSSVYSIDSNALGFYHNYDSMYGNYQLLKTEGFTIFARTGSAAYEYAKANGFNVVDNDASTNGKTLSDVQSQLDNTKALLAKAIAKLESCQLNYDSLKDSSGTSSKELKQARAELKKAKNQVLKLKAKARTVKGLKATAKKKGRVSLSWKKSSGAKGYQVFRSTKKKSRFKKVATIKKVGTKKWTDKTTKKSKVYYYKIRPYNIVSGKTVFGKWSSVVKVKTKKK